jgi:hypothetical protein
MKPNIFKHCWVCLSLKRACALCLLTLSAVAHGGLRGPHEVGLGGDPQDRAASPPHWLPNLQLSLTEPY